MEQNSAGGFSTQTRTFRIEVIKSSKPFRWISRMKLTNFRKQDFVGNAIWLSLTSTVLTTALIKLSVLYLYKIHVIHNWNRVKLI